MISSLNRKITDEYAIELRGALRAAGLTSVVSINSNATVDVRLNNEQMAALIELLTK